MDSAKAKFTPTFERHIGDLVWAGENDRRPLIDRIEY